MRSRAGGSGRGSPSRVGVAEREAAQSLKLGVGQARQQDAELVGGHAHSRGACREDVQLLILDAVFHVAAGAVDAVAQIALAVRQIGHHEARVGAEHGVLGP